jgi:hypothetical protein
VLIIVREIEAVLDERGTRVRVITDAISAHPGVQDRQREQKEHTENKFRFARAWLR